MFCLIVDDNATDRVDLEEAISDSFASRVDQASSYSDAVSKLKGYLDKDDVPELVFLDYALSSENTGIDLIKEMKRLRINCAVIIMTGLENETLSRQAEALGVDIILKEAISEKSFVNEVCLRAIARWSQLRRIQMVNLARHREDFIRTVSSLSHDIKGRHKGLQNCARVLRKMAQTHGAPAPELDLVETKFSDALKLTEHLLQKLIRYGHMANRTAELSVICPSETIRTVIDHCSDEVAINFTVCNDCKKLFPLDPLLIEHVFKILSENVDIHCSSGTEVFVSVTNQVLDGRSYLEVLFWDNGHGVPEDKRKKIFNPSYQIKNTPLGGGLEGYGLGLPGAADAIAQHQIDGYTATIKCVSPPEGSGACFRMMFPGPVQK